MGQVVEEPALTEEGTILVEVCIREDAPRIDKNAVFQISSLSILGDKAVMISPPATPEERAGEFIEDGAFIEGAEPGGLDALQTDAGRIAADAAELLSRGKGTLTKIEGGLDDLRAVASRLTESLDRINGGVISDENLAAFSSTQDAPTTNTPARTTGNSVHHQDPEFHGMHPLSPYNPFHRYLHAAL